MFAHVQLAILTAGALACLTQLFGGLFDSHHDLFHAAPIALLALLPVVTMRRTPQTTLAAWSLAVIFVASYLHEHLDPGSRFNAFDILEWATLVIALRDFHKRPRMLEA